jgi:hypothetical protein
MCATAVLFDIEETWDATKRFLLGDIKFLEKMVEFNVDKCKESKFIKLRESYLKR